MVHAPQTIDRPWLLALPAGPHGCMEKRQGARPPDSPPAGSLRSGRIPRVSSCPLLTERAAVYSLPSREDSMSEVGEAPSSQAVTALLKLRGLILSGELKAGERMSELVLVERIGVSRTPIRAALLRLEQEGLL